MRISDWSSDVCSSDLADAAEQAKAVMAFETRLAKVSKSREEFSRNVELYYNPVSPAEADELSPNFPFTKLFESQGVERSEEHTSELQSLMRISYAVFCLKKKKKNK